MPTFLGIHFLKYSHNLNGLPALFFLHFFNVTCWELHKFCISKFQAIKEAYVWSVNSQNTMQIFLISSSNEPIKWRVLWHRN